MALIQKIIKGRKHGGYTVIEVMIVLSVSSVLLISAIAGYSRQNARKQFENAIRQTEVTLRDVVNDVEVGYYPNSDSFTCKRSGGAPVFPQIDTFGSSAQGTNEDCIFLGKAVILDSGIFNVYTMVGLRNKASDPQSLSTDVDEAANRPITVPGTFDTHPLHASLSIDHIVAGGTLLSNPGFVVVSGFGHGKVGGAGATTNQVVVSSFSPESDGRLVSVAGLVDRDITICIKEAGGSREASITIGSGFRGNVETSIDPWSEDCN